VEEVQPENVALGLRLSQSKPLYQAYKALRWVFVAAGAVAVLFVAFKDCAQSVAAAGGPTLQHHANTVASAQVGSYCCSLCWSGASDWGPLNQPGD
jgi:hypothetical protein